MSKPFNFDVHIESTWLSDLEVIENRAFERESFNDWSNRNKDLVGHLPAELTEQWVYRHQQNSPFSFLPLETLACSMEIWSEKRILQEAHRVFGGRLEPKFDYETFQQQGGTTRMPTAKALDQGTWDYPMVLLHTPNGIIDHSIHYPDTRFVILEGHQRHRYLNALHKLGMPPKGPHKVLIVSSPLVNGTGE